MKNNALRSYLENLSVLRNLSAHYNRLYYFKFSKIPSNLPKAITTVEGLNRRLIVQIFAMKEVYYDKDEWNEQFIGALKSLLGNYQGVVRLEHLGFIEGWDNLLSKKG